MSIQFLEDPKEMDPSEIAELFSRAGIGRKRNLGSVAKAFQNSSFALIAKAGGKTVASGRVISDRRAWALMTDLAVLPEYQELGDELLERLICRFRGQELFTWTCPDRIDFFERHGFRRSKNSFTYAGEKEAALDPMLPIETFYLPVGYRFESEFYPRAGKFPVGRKNPHPADSLQAVFSERSEEIDFTRLNEILTEAFGGRERDEAVTRECFLNSPYVEYVHIGEKLVGCARAESDGVLQALLLNVAIDPAYQGLRLGWEIVTRLAAQMKGQNIFLNTHPGGVGFYNRKGFRRNKTALVYPAHPDMPDEIARGFMLPVGYRFVGEY